MTSINHLAIVVQDLDKSVRLMSEGFGLTVGSVKDYPNAGMKVALMKADNIDVELIEPTGPGIYWQFKALGPATFNHLAFDAGTIMSLEERSKKLGIKAREDGTRKTDVGSITDLDPKTTLGLRVQLFSRT